MKDYGRLENIQVKLNRMRQESKDPDFTKYLDDMQVVLDKQCMSANYLSGEIDRNYSLYISRFGVQAEEVQVQPPVQEQPKPVVQPQFSQAAPQPQVQQPVAQPQPAQVAPQPAYMANPQWLYQPRVPQKKNSMEFKVGAGLFCVIGVVFILLAFVMLGITYMNGLVKGLCLYAISGVLILLSELLLRKRMEKFSHGITGLGISGLYASTIINCAFLENFNSVVALIVTVVISLLAIFISRKKDSGMIKIISFIGCYVCFWPAGSMGNDIDFFVFTIVMFAVNFVSVLLPVKKHAAGVHITHQITNGLFVLPLTLCALDQGTEAGLCAFFVLTNILIQGLIFHALERGVKQKRAAGMYCEDAGYIISYCALLFVESALYVGCAVEVSHNFLLSDGSAKLWYHISMLGYLLPGVLFFLLFAKTKLKWIQYYAAIVTAWIAYVLCGDTLENVICILTIFVISKLLSRVKALKVSEIVITSVTAFAAMLYMGCVEYYDVFFAGAFLLSILALRYYKTFHQSILTFVVVIFIAVRMWEVSLLPSAAVGVLFLLMLLFNHVKVWSGKWQVVYNCGNLVFMCFWCLIATFVQDYLNSIILALLGTAVIVLIFRKKYNMEFKFKYLVLALFWTYMTLTCGIETAVITSSVLMVIAIASVITGFVLKRKEVRIYGLVLSILVSFKVMFYDFMETPILERMLLFLIVGVIILSISCIYIILKKKMANRGEIL
ncbi:MAG: DUF2339 domain-containing protein [Lachnospiraceae bacterium]|nr:DUF2339 domain-containing protein [Lachnospiraceae bacterium]